jgi:hypothetical protein
MVLPRPSPHGRILPSPCRGCVANRLGQAARQSQNLTHWSVFWSRKSPPASRGLIRFHGQKNSPSGGVIGAIEVSQTLKQSVDAGRVPFAAERGWYLSRVQLTRDGPSGEASFPKFMNCLAQCLGSHVHGPLDRQSLDAVAGQPEAREHPCYRSAMPATTTGRRYSPPVQFIRQRTLRDETGCHKLLKGREYIEGRLVRSRAGRPTLSGRDAPIYSLHPAIMADPWFARLGCGPLFNRGKSEEKTPLARPARLPPRMWASR